MATLADVDTETGKWWVLGLITPAIGFVVIAVYALQFSFRTALSVLAVGAAVGGAAWLGGVLLGFLFGIPRAVIGGTTSDAVGAGDGTTSFRFNTNLEQISDWLTKIIVGVGLVQLAQAPSALGRLAENLAPGFGGTDSSATFALALLFYFVISGFLASYVWVQLRYRGELHRTERRLKLENLQDENLQDDQWRPSLSDISRFFWPPPEAGSAGHVADLDLADEKLSSGG